MLDEVTKQIVGGNRSIIGVMLESNLEEGNQPIPDDLSEIRPGVSVTDACIRWESTAAALGRFAKSIRQKFSEKTV